MPWHIIHCNHVTACGEPRDMVEEQYEYYHHNRDIDICDDYDDYYYTEHEVLEAIGHSDLTEGDVL